MKTNKFFDNTAFMLYREHLPIKLSSRFIMMDLIREQKIEFTQGRQSIIFTLKPEDNLLLNGVCLMIKQVTPENELPQSILNTKKSIYVFAKKNLASWRFIDEFGIEKGNSNPSAYLFAENAALASETQKAVNTIIKEINKVRPQEVKASRKADTSCECRLM